MTEATPPRRPGEDARRAAHEARVRWAEIVNHAIGERNLSLNAAAKAIGISPGRLQAWLSQDVEPSPRVMADLARVIGRGHLYLMQVLGWLPQEMGDAPLRLEATERLNEAIADAQRWLGSATSATGLRAGALVAATLLEGDPNWRVTLSAGMRGTRYPVRYADLLAFTPPADPPAVLDPSPSATPQSANGAPTSADPPTAPCTPSDLRLPPSAEPSVEPPSVEPSSAKSSSAEPSSGAGQLSVAGLPPTPARSSARFQPFPVDQPHAGPVTPQRTAADRARVEELISGTMARTSAEWLLPRPGPAAPWAPRPDLVMSVPALCASRPRGIRPNLAVPPGIVVVGAPQTGAREVAALLADLLDWGYHDLRALAVERFGVSPDAPRDVLDRAVTAAALPLFRDGGTVASQTVWSIEEPRPVLQTFRDLKPGLPLVILLRAPDGLLARLATTPDEDGQSDLVETAQNVVRRVLNATRNDDSYLILDLPDAIDPPALGTPASASPPAGFDLPAASRNPANAGPSAGSGTVADAGQSVASGTVADAGQSVASGPPAIAGQSAGSDMLSSPGTPGQDAVFDSFVDIAFRAAEWLAHQHRGPDVADSTALLGRLRRR